MKKVFSSVLLLVLTVGTFNLNSNQVSAASRASQKVNLTEGQTSNSTARVIGNSEASYTVENRGKQMVSYRIFQNGFAITDYILLGPSSWRANSRLPTTKNAGYSIRIYCKSKSGTGCKANAVISNHKM